LKLVVILGTYRNSKYDEIARNSLLPWLKGKKKKENTAIIVSGGYTNPATCLLSEAEDIVKLLLEEGIPQEKLFMELGAITTRQNIEFVLKKLAKGDFEDIVDVKKNKLKKVTFAGEAGSEKEVLWLAPKIFRKYFPDKDISIPEFDFYRLLLLSSKERQQKEKKLIIMKIAYYLPPVDWILTFLRRIYVF